MKDARHHISCCSASLGVILNSHHITFIYIHWQGVKVKNENANMPGPLWPIEVFYEFFKQLEDSAICEEGEGGLQGWDELSVLVDR